MREIPLIVISILVPIILIVIIVNSPKPMNPEPVIYQPKPLKTTLGDIGCTGAPTRELMSDLDKYMGCEPTSDIKIGNSTIIITVGKTNRTFQVNEDKVVEIQGVNGVK